MRIQINKAHFPVTTLGPGRRIGLWLQGCHIRCRGCISRDTWEPDPEREIEVTHMLNWCRVVAPAGPDGVTISGGEPFEQPLALSALLDGLLEWRHQLASPFDILCYSGLPLRRLERQHCDILARLDALIPEPYVEGLPLARIWRGSANQLLVLLSSLAEERYAGFLDASAPTNLFQVTVEERHVWCIGLPHRSDMGRLEAAARRRGVVLGDVSWRA